MLSTYDWAIIDSYELLTVINEEKDCAVTK